MMMTHLKMYPLFVIPVLSRKETQFSASIHLNMRVLYWERIEARNIEEKRLRWMK